MHRPRGISHTGTRSDASQSCVVTERTGATLAWNRRPPLDEDNATVGGSAVHLYWAVRQEARALCAESFTVRYRWNRADRGEEDDEEGARNDEGGTKGRGGG